jgi:acetyltransferase-like isoleucine patch superfamily enzyme
MPNGHLKIGNDVLVNNFSVLGSSERVEIMDHCIFAAYVQITDAAHGFEDPTLMIKHAPFTTAPVTIEENVWLGSAVLIAKGVTVGKGSVIGAKSLVNTCIPPLSIAYGTPAKVVKVRGE